ncbi:hypothetical protein K6025_04540 [Ehrlichia sp. JZT12]
MRFFLHDISRIGVSLIGVALGTLSTANQGFKKCLSLYLKDDNFVTQDEFKILNNSVKELMLKQSKIEEQLSQK